MLFRSCSSLLMYFKLFQQNKMKIIPNKITACSTYHNPHHYYTESNLIKKLEDLGIGRPSTYALFVETIQEKGYVKKVNIEGEKIMCNDYQLINDVITEISNLQTIYIESFPQNITWSVSPYFSGNQVSFTCVGNPVNPSQAVKWVCNLEIVSSTFSL